MEKIQKINKWLLIVSGIAVLIVTGPMLVFLLVGVLFMSSDGVVGYSSMTMHDFLMLPVDLLKLAFYDFFIIPSLIFSLALFFSVKRNYISIALSITTLLCTIGIAYFQYYKAEMSDIEFNTTLDINDWCTDTDGQEAPTAGFLVPDADFIPSTFPQTRSKMTYCTDQVMALYSYSEKSNLHPTITYIEKANTADKKLLASDNVVREFVFQGQSGQVIQHKYYRPNDPGHVSYLLYWHDGEKLVKIFADNVPSSQITPEDMEHMLRNLDRVQ